MTKTIWNRLRCALASGLMLAFGGLCTPDPAPVDGHDDWRAQVTDILNQLQNGWHDVQDTLDDLDLDDE